MNEKPRVVIIDYGMGNLFSIKNACSRADIDVIISSSKDEIALSDAIILPGVGAFPKAMETLKELDLISTIKNAAESNKPIWGICLGMQLLMETSEEYGDSKGLGIINGSVRALDKIQIDNGKRVKIPHINWNHICERNDNSWDDTLLESLKDGEYMYFVHSYYCVPDNPEIVLSTTKYGATEFCSSLQHGNTFACQFHPEKSGEKGILMYKNFSMRINKKKKKLM